MASSGKSSKSRQSPSVPDPIVSGEDVASAEIKKRRWLSMGTVTTVLFLGTMGGMAVLVARSVPELRTRSEYQFPLAEMQFTPPHEWMPQTILQEVLANSGLPETVSLLDPQICKQVAGAWERHPWVKRVISVKISATPALVVELEYRRPAAFIRVVDGFYPVDEEGVLLPPRDFATTLTDRLPQIRNISTIPQGSAGTTWGDPIVTAAVKLAMTLAPQQDMNRYWSKFQFQAILAPVGQRAATEEPIFELETAGGNRIVWGKAPGADALEPAIDVKLARLAEYQTRFGSLDGVSGKNRIDIRLFDGISLQPLSEIQYR